MTKQSYIKKVKRKLVIPKELKAAIISDLQESFDSAKEQGETPESVIERLGTPEDFVSDVMENSDFTTNEIRLFKRRKNIFVLSIFFALAAVLTTIWAVLYSMPMSMNVIGYSNTSTTIEVTGGFGYLIPYILCGVFWVLFFVLLISLIYLKKR